MGVDKATEAKRLEKCAHLLASLLILEGKFDVVREFVVKAYGVAVEVVKHD